MKHQEEKIVQCLREGNVICVKMIFDNYYQVLCVFALRFLNSFEDAEDIVQDVFVDFWEKRKGSSFTGSIKSFLFGAVQKAALNQIRSSGRLIFEEIEVHMARFIDEIVEESDEDIATRKEKLYGEIQRLPEKCREVFIAIVLENLTYKEVAEKLNVSVNTVKTHYARALKQLRDKLDTIILMILFHQHERVAFLR